MSTDNDSVVTLSEINYCYGKQQALESLSLTIPHGKLCGFIGPDGVGKSTLLSLISGARALQTGQLHVLGEDLSQSRQRKHLYRRLAYMPQGLGKTFTRLYRLRRTSAFSHNFSALTVNNVDAVSVAC